MKSCSRKILDLFYNAKHAGRIIKPDAIGRVGGQDDGLVIELSWRIANDTVIDAKFRAFGNPNAIAITSLMTDYFIGKTLEEVMNIDESVIVEALDELKPEYLEVYEIVCSAMAEAYEYYLKRKDKREHEFAASEVGEVGLDTINTVEVEQELTQEEVERRIQLNIQRELFGEVKSGRGRPRKERLEGEEIISGERRSRGRPRKERTPEELEALALAATEKRGRGRPKKERTPEELEALALARSSSRGRGRPKKERTPEELEAIALAQAEKRGRGRPKKERTPEELEALALAATEKRGRGRPRKERIEIEVIGEKRGRGRPRKEVEEEIEVGEKRGRGRPRKTEPVKINFPKSDLDEIITDEVVEQLISGSSADKTIKENSIEENSNAFGEQYASNVTQAEDDIEPRVIESNVGNDGAVIETEQSNVAVNYALGTADEAYQSEVYEEFEEKRGRGRPRKERIQIEVIGEKRGRGRPRKEVEEEIEVGEKRGRGRPRKERTEEELVALASTEKRGRGRPRKEISEDVEVAQGEKRGRGRPRKEVDLEQTADETEEKRGRGRPRKEENVSMLNPINSLTRSLTTNGMPSYHKTQDIVFASKNVTTTNININVVKTTNSNGETNNEYSKNVNVISTTEDAAISNSAYTNLSQQDVEQDDELEVESVNQDLNTNEEVVDTKSDNADKDYYDEQYEDLDADNEDIDDYNMDADYEDELDDEDSDEDIDASHIKDEAPKGGIEDLLRALLDD